MSINHQLRIVFMFLLLGVAGTLTGTGTAYSDKKKSTGNVEVAVGAKVTIEQAIKTTSEKVSGKIIEGQLKPNNLVWRVKVIKAESKVLEVHIDAESGVVISVEEGSTTSKKF